MSRKCEDEFNPWPSFVDIFSSVILVLLLFLLVIIVNLAYQAQFKFRVSYTGTIATDDLILKNNKTMKEGTPDSKEKFDPQKAITNSDINVQIIKEDQQYLLLLKKQGESETSSDKNSAQIESPGTHVAGKVDTNEKNQTIKLLDDYIIVSYKADEVFVDDGTTKELKNFLKTAENKYGKGFKVEIYAKEIKNQISATVSKQISLARTLSLKNLFKKFGYDKKDVSIDLVNQPEIKENIDDTNGYVVVKVKK